MDGGARNAGGKREAANQPDKTKVQRAKWGKAARGDCAGWPAERQQVGRSAKYKQTQGHRAKWERAASRDRAGCLAEHQQKVEETGRRAKNEATCGPKGWEGKG